MPSISDLTPNQQTYNITDSKAVLANFSLDFNVSDVRQFTLSYPASAAVTASLALIEPGPPLTRDIQGLVPPSGSIGSYGVTANVVTNAGISTLTCTITDTSISGDVDVQFELLATSTTNVDWTLSNQDGNSNFQTFRIVIDPVAQIVPLGGGQLEQSTVTLTAADANAGTIFGSVPWGTAPTLTYQFGHTGPIAITGLDTDVLTVDNTDVPLPGVYGSVNVPFHVIVTRASADPEDTWSFANQGPSTPVTIDPRPQRVALVIDRSGSMGAEGRYENAKTAAQMFISLFGEFRNNVHAQDMIGMVAFEDDTCVFADPGTTPPGPPFPVANAATEVIMSMRKPDEAVAALPTIAFGSPGTCTNIGDGLAAAMKMIQDEGAPLNVRYTVVLMTDGDENSGFTQIGTPLDPAGPDSWNTRKTYSDINVVANSPDLRLFTIALGSLPNNAVLASLSPTDAFSAALDVSDLVDAFGTILGASQEIRQVVPRHTEDLLDPPEPVPAPGAGLNAVYFSTATGAAKLGFVVHRNATVVTPNGTAAGGTIRLAYRPQGAGAFTVVPGTVIPQVFDNHVYIGIPNVASLTGTAGPVDWRVENIVAAVPATIHEKDVLAYEDLHVKADFLLDKRTYLTGDDMNLTVRIRHDGDPVRNATVRAELDAPVGGLGTMLASLDPAAVEQDARRIRSPKDRPQGRAALIEALLHDNDWKGLPRRLDAPPTGLFEDGTDLLHDPDGDGNYQNTFNRVFADGVYNWTVFVDGVDSNGGAFNQVLKLTTLAAVSVSPKKTTVVKEFVKDLIKLPQLAVKVTITPQDDRKLQLGPGFDATVIWALKDGQFEHVVNQQPAPVNTDGTYTRTILFKLGKRPTLNVSVNGVLLPKIEVWKAPLLPGLPSLAKAE